MESRTKPWMLLALVCGLLYIFLISLVVHLRTQDQENSQSLQQAQIQDKMDPKKVPNVAIFDLGIATASVITLPDHKAILVNVGDLVSSNKLLSKLHDCTIDQIDTLILTDTDYRHLGGLGPIIQSFPVEHVLMPKVCPSYVIRMLDELNIEHHTVNKDTLLQMESVQVQLLPSTSTDFPNRLDVQCSYQGSSVWFMDPSYTPTKDITLRSHSNVDLCVLDHGYTADDTLQWMSNRPIRYAVLTANDGIEETEQTMDRLQAEGIYSFRTDHQGDMQFALGKSRIELLSRILFDEMSPQM